MCRCFGWRTLGTSWSLIKDLMGRDIRRYSVWFRRLGRCVRRLLGLAHDNVDKRGGAARTSRPSESDILCHSLRAAVSQLLKSRLGRSTALWLLLSQIDGTTVRAWWRRRNLACAEWRTTGGQRATGLVFGRRLLVVK